MIIILLDILVMFQFYMKEFNKMVFSQKSEALHYSIPGLPLWKNGFRLEFPLVVVALDVG